MIPVAYPMQERLPVVRGAEGVPRSAGEGRDVLFVMTGKERRSVGLLRAAALARMSGGRLFVACAAPRWVRHNVLFPHRNGPDSLAAPSAHAGLLARVRAFCDGVLLEPLPDDRLIVEEGDAAQVAAAVAERLGVAAVVLGAAGDGRTATEVACRARVPVLVARRVRQGAIVAATDLEDVRYPVVRQASDLAGQLDERATFVHNVPPGPGLGLNAAGLGLVPEEEILAEYSGRLRAIARLLPIAADVAVLSRPSAADAILEIAAEADADLVVVGAHARSWFGRLLSPGTAEVVVDRAGRSVLVLPLPEDEAEEAVGALAAWAA